MSSNPTPVYYLDDSDDALGDPDFDPKRKYSGDQDYDSSDSELWDPSYSPRRKIRRFEDWSSICFKFLPHFDHLELYTDTNVNF